VSWEGWVEVGREYMKKAREAGEWKSVLYALAHTLQMATGEEERLVARTEEVAGGAPEEARRRCPLDPKLFEGYKLQNRRTYARAVCDKAERWEKIREVCGRCKREGDREETVRWARETLREMKRRGEDVVGLGWKGIDMLLLDCGCETPVVDRHLARHLARVSPEARKVLDNPETDEELRKSLYDVQRDDRPDDYDKLRSIAEDLARREGTPPGVWHVAVWMREHFKSLYPDRPEEKLQEMARSYVERIFR
jgi:hypothetical protein